MNTHFNRNILPFILFFVVSFFLYQAVISTPTANATVKEVSKRLPAFAQPSVLAPEKVLSDKDLLGQPSVVHVWASWCKICAEEQGQWLKIAKQSSYPIYGLNFKDDLDRAQNWLAEYGNPFAENIYDPLGSVGFDLGVRGTPETFLISPYGKVIAHIEGPMSAELFERTVTPMLEDMLQEAG